MIPVAHPLQNQKIAAVSESWSPDQNIKKIYSIPKSILHMKKDSDLVSIWICVPMSSVVRGHKTLWPEKLVDMSSLTSVPISANEDTNRDKQRIF